MTDPPPRWQAARRRHWEILVVASLVVVLAFAMQIRPDGLVALAALPDYPLPPSCPSYTCFGVKCPGCGLTRSLIHLAHGHWEASREVHPVGWVLAAAILLQFPYRILALRRGGRPPLGTVFPQVFGYGLIALLVGNWLWEMVGNALSAQ
jgi:hypothetical protein